MIFRDATREDATAIAGLHAESWRSAYRGILSDDYLENEAHRERLATWQKKFSAETNKPMFVIVAEIEQQLAGFVCIFPEESTAWGSFLDNLHVAPKLTGQGIGRRLLSEGARRLVLADSRSGLYFWVIEQNKKARRFYERTGAVIVGSAQNSAPDGQNVLALRCHWPDPARLVLKA
jgi:ribosomal protein S18 acetylase RimI-like enzyme